MLIAEEDLVRAALEALLASWQGIDVIGQAATKIETVVQLQRIQADVILLSIAGIENVDRNLVSEMAQVCGRAPLVVLVMDCDQEFRSDLLSLGATAVVLRTTDPSELHRAIAESVTRESRG